MSLHSLNKHGVLLDKPAVAQLLKNFLTFYGIRKVHYRASKKSRLAAALSQMNPLHTMIHFNIILPPMSWSS
jgi:hypothetical protein